MRFAFSIVSRRDVAVMTCDEPAVKDVKRKSVGESSKEKEEWFGSSTGEADMMKVFWRSVMSSFDGSRKEGYRQDSGQLSASRVR